MDTKMHTQGYNYADIMLEYMPVGVALFDAQDLRLLAANALYQSFLLPEWRDGRAIGHPLSDWGPQPYTCFIEPLLCKVAETGIPYRGEEVHIPHPKRGHTYWNWTIDPVRASNGHIMHLLNTASDVTGQVLARQATEQAHASLSQVNTAPLYTENGDITGAVSVYHDITERKSIEQHKNEFLSIASHELRTPITAIQGFAEILQIQASRGADLDSP